MSPGRRRTVNDLLTERATTWPEAVTPVTRLMVPMLRFGSLAIENVKRRVAAHGLGFAEFEVLITLRGVAAPYALAPGDLSAAILMSSGGLTKVLYALEEKSLITRATGATDGRSKPVRLTAKGRALAERVMAAVLASERDFIARALSDADVAHLTRLMRKLLATLEPDDAAGLRGDASKDRSK